MFPEDSMQIANMQYDVYGKSLILIIEEARRRYLHAEQVIGGLETEIGRFYKHETKFDHRTLQGLHDAIAGQFRLNFCLKSDLFDYHLEWSSDEAQMIMIWNQFLREEIERLHLIWTCLPERIGTAIYFSNPDKRGMEAEEYLHNLTLFEYQDLNL